MAITTYTQQKTLPYSSEQLFDLVADIKAYPSFLPWCVGMRILQEDQDEMIADLTIGYKFIRETFRSKVFLNKPQRIAVEYLSGPLKNLSNKWKFIDNGDGTCTIDFYVAFEFKNPLLKKLVQIFFDEIVKRMVSSFEKRAHELYAANATSLASNPA